MTPGDVLRPLGALERGYDLWGRSHPFQFCIAAQLTDQLTDGVNEESVRAALQAVRRRHPLLSARVHDPDPGDRLASGPVFVAVDDEATLRVAVRGGWREAVAEELATPFAPASGPLFRAVLVPGTDRDSGRGPALVLTFEHAVADGLSAVAVLRELLDALEGGGPSPSPPAPALPVPALPVPALPLPVPALPVPPAQEDLLPAPAPASPTDPGAPVDPRLMTPAVLRPTGPEHPDVIAREWTVEQTAQLRRRCREEGVTVTAALVSAAVTTIARSGREFVRASVPITLDHVLDLRPATALYIGGHRPGWDAAQLGEVWPVARDLAADLGNARTPGALAAASAGVRSLWESPTLEAVEAALVVGNAFDVLVSNLGELADDPRVAALWGPVLLNHQVGEQVVGVTTVAGRLRLLAVSHDPVPGLLDQVQEVLLR